MSITDVNKQESIIPDVSGGKDLKIYTRLALISYTL